VDDREDNLVSIEAILAPSGYTFVRANSGRMALKILLDQFDFAMILMDVKMPNLNGFETASLIYERDRLRHIPIIFITANSYGDENIFKGYQAGGIDYIYKPINPEVLRAKVGVLVDLYRKTTLLHEQEQKLIAANKNLELEVADRKASEEKVKQLNRRLLLNISNLESVNKDLERFAFMASHDLQEPLRKIRVFSDRLVLKHGQMLGDDVNTIRRIQQSAERMQALITDILSFSKISIEKSEFVNTDLNVLVSELVTDMADEVKEKQGKVTIEPLPKLFVSPGLMRPLFQNLISNSLKYARKEVEPVIRIRSEETQGTNGRSNGHTPVNKYCRILIEDNGIGFDQKYADEIFGIFRRLHSNGDYEGTGIGLALCKKIVEQHNGFISARGRLNEGATFIISLPVKQEE
jgi:signal transduction histidine kinase